MVRPQKSVHVEVRGWWVASKPGDGRGDVVPNTGRRGSLPLNPTPPRVVVEYRGPVTVVLLQMTIEVGLLAEATLAEGALVRLLLVVNVPHVTLEVRRDAEAPLAVLALVGLLASVGPQVASQVGRPREHLAAKLASVPFFRLLDAGRKPVLVVLL